MEPVVQADYTASRVERAVASVIADRSARTYDMGGTSSTLQMAEAIAMRIPKALAAGV